MKRQQLQPKKKFDFHVPKKEAAPSGALCPTKLAEPGPGLADGEWGGPPLCKASGTRDRELEVLQRDVLLSELCGCRVRLCSNPNTLQVLHCCGCSVLCGPVSTLALLDGCSDCLLRTHRTTHCWACGRVTNRAITEACPNVSFPLYS